MFFLFVEEKGAEAVFGLTHSGHHAQGQSSGCLAGADGSMPGISTGVRGTDSLRGLIKEGHYNLKTPVK